MYKHFLLIFLMPAFVFCTDPDLINLINRQDTTFLSIADVAIVNQAYGAAFKSGQTRLGYTEYLLQNAAVLCDLDQKKRQQLAMMKAQYDTLMQRRLKEAQAEYGIVFHPVEKSKNVIDLPIAVGCFVVAGVIFAATAVGFLAITRLERSLSKSLA
jgi:hypothetical protein